MTPKGWKRRRVQDFGTRSKIINVEGAELPPLSITKGRGVVLQSDKYKKQIATDLRKYIIARRDQFAFDPMSLYYGAIGQVTLEVGLVSPDYVVLDVDQSVDKRFMNYLFRQSEQVALYESVAETGNSFGKRRRVYWSVFADLEFTLPPVEEQRKVAAILSVVDDVIEGTQAVIDQFQLVKKAMMAELLTRGLPGRHTRFKETEIGEVPEAWAVERLAAVAAVQTGVAKGKKVEHGVDVPYLRVANVQDGYVDLSEVKTIAVERGLIGRYSLKAGDVLFTEGGDADKLGRGCVWRAQIDPCLHQNHVFAVRTDRNKLLPQFLGYWAASPRGRAYFLDCAKQTTNLASINSTQLKAFPVPLPTIEEQAKIVESIDAVDHLLRIEREFADHVAGVRAALMSVLLTGELRVTPDEATP